MTSANWSAELEAFFEYRAAEVRGSPTIEDLCYVASDCDWRRDRDLYNARVGHSGEALY
jgi:hypothetical protein